MAGKALRLHSGAGMIDGISVLFFPVFLRFSPEKEPKKTAA